MSVFKKVNDSERNVNATLYIGNLDSNVTEGLLYEVFIQVAPVRYVNLPKDRILRTHQGFGFVEFKTEKDAEYVTEVLKNVRLYGRILRLRPIERSKPSGPNTSTVGTTNSQTNSGIDIGAKIFIKNLNPLIDEKYLMDTFSSFGNIIYQPTIMRDQETGESKGYGFISFDDFTSSDKAIESMNNKLLMNSKVSIAYAFKDGTKLKERHGDSAERTLAENAKLNKASNKRKRGKT